LKGGWESVATQNTKITPDITRAALQQVKKFTDDFNKYLAVQGELPVKMGNPTGSSAYYDVDDEDKIYGDIDLQMIAKEQKDMTTNQLTAFYNKHMNDFIKTTKPDYIYDEGKEIRGHVIFIIGTPVFVQVDFIWAIEKEADWARYRTTPERGVKGLVYGSLYSSFGEVINMIKDGLPVNFQKSRKVDSVETLSLDIENFGIDILRELFQRTYPDTPIGAIQIDPELKANPGLVKDDIKMSSLVSVIRGLGKSFNFKLNDMYGKYNLVDIESYPDLISTFMAHFKSKTDAAKVAKKFDKAETPQAIAKVKEIRQQIDSGVETVEKLIYA
jgi:hypothetical protein